LNHIVYGNGCYVAVAEFWDSGYIYSSADGFHWTLRYTDNDAWGLHMAYNNGYFLGIGGVETAFSANGTNWTI
jgi:hypothetical protein